MNIIDRFTVQFELLSYAQWWLVHSPILSHMYLLRHPPNAEWVPHLPGCDCDRAVLYLTLPHLQLTAQSTQTGKGREVCQCSRNFLKKLS